MIMFNIFGQGKDKSEREFSKIKGKIFPVVKVKVSESGGKVLEIPAESSPLFREIAGDLLCFYGIDKGDNFVLLNKSQLPATVSLDDLDQIAKENLLADVEKNLQLHETNFGAFGFSCGGNHEAALILLPEIWGILNDKLGEDIVFGVPSKDMCVFVSANSKEGIEGVQKMIVDIHQDGERLLSKKLFKYNSGQIALY
jgi:uncharacterized protein YtpQ (UPF0354 family)